MKPIINHFTDNDLYSFTCMYYISQKYPRAEMEYCFFDRNRTCYPKGFEQMLREQLEHLAHVVITDEDIRHHSHDGGLPSIRAFIIQGQ